MKCSERLLLNTDKRDKLASERPRQWPVYLRPPRGRKSLQIARISARPQRPAGQILRISSYLLRPKSTVQTQITHLTTDSTGLKIERLHSIMCHLCLQTPTRNMRPRSPPTFYGKNSFRPQINFYLFYPHKIIKIHKGNKFKLKLTSVL